MEDHQHRADGARKYARHEQNLIPGRPTGVPPTRIVQNASPDGAIIKPGPSRRTTDALVVRSSAQLPRPSHAIPGLSSLLSSDAHDGLPDRDLDRVTTSALSNYLSKASREHVIHVGRGMTARSRDERSSLPTDSRSMPSLGTKQSMLTSRVRSRSQYFFEFPQRGTSQAREIDSSRVQPQLLFRSRPDSSLLQASSLESLESSPLEELISRLKVTAGLSHTAARNQAYHSKTSPRIPLLHGQAFYNDEPKAGDQSTLQASPVQAIIGSPEQCPPDTRTSVPPRCVTSRMSNCGAYYPRAVLGDHAGRTPPISDLSFPLPAHTIPRHTQYNYPDTYHDADRTLVTPRRAQDQSALRMSRTPRLRVYDDQVPADFQPQTPAELRYRHAKLSHARRTAASRRSKAIMTNLHPAMIPPGESRYPSVTNMTTTQTPADPVSSPTMHVTQRSTRRATRIRPVQQENFQDIPLSMEEERRIWAVRAGEPSGQETMVQTPPQEGRFERFLR